MSYIERCLTKGLAKEIDPEGGHPNHPFSHTSIHNRNSQGIEQMLGGHVCFYVKYIDPLARDTRYAPSADQAPLGVEITELKVGDVIGRDIQGGFKLVFDPKGYHMLHGYGSVPVRIEPLNSQ